ncbi:hypothetical protein [Bacillus massilinigeriensis]|nr:hypothetical protein [Bacillus mediterraneensis]
MAAKRKDKEYNEYERKVLGRTNYNDEYKNNKVIPDQQNRLKDQENRRV